MLVTPQPIAGSRLFIIDSDLLNARVLKSKSSSLDLDSLPFGGSLFDQFSRMGVRFACQKVKM